MTDTAKKLSEKVRVKSLSSNRTFILGAVILTVLCVCLLSFVAGVHYGKSSRPAAAVAQTSGQFGQAFGGPAGRSGRRGITGQVTAISASSISVSNSRTGSVDVLDIISTTQVINNGQSASVSDIHVGDRVVIRANSSNQKQAAQIMLNPQSMGPGGMNTPPTPPNNNAVTN